MRCRLAIAHWNADYVESTFRSAKEPLYLVRQNERSVAQLPKRFREFGFGFFSLFPRAVGKRACRVASFPNKGTLIACTMAANN
jgi:hypothetical protein